MTVYVMGGARTAFTVGMARCDERDANLPFIAFAPTAEVASELHPDAVHQTIETKEEVEAVIEVFKRHGTVVFIDTPTAAEHIMNMFDALLAIAWDTRWSERQPSKETVN